MVVRSTGGYGTTSRAGKGNDKQLLLRQLNPSFPICSHLLQSLQPTDTEVLQKVTKQVLSFHTDKGCVTQHQAACKVLASIHR